MVFSRAVDFPEPEELSLRIDTGWPGFMFSGN
jgi:hypothetical protein